MSKKKHKKGSTWRVSSEERANGLYSYLLVKKGPRASTTVDKSKVIPRKRKYKNLED